MSFFFFYRDALFLPVDAWMSSSVAFLAFLLIHWNDQLLTDQFLDEADRGLVVSHAELGFDLPGADPARASDVGNDVTQGVQ